MLLVWGLCWGRYTTAILPDKDDEDYNQPTNQPILYHLLYDKYYLYEALGRALYYYYITW